MYKKCSTKSRRKQEENRKWKHRATKGSRKQAEKESRKEKQKVDWRS